MKLGWEIRPLGEVAELSGGGTPSKKRPDFWQGDIPWVSPKDMKSEVVFDSEDHITANAIDGSATRQIPAGSLLIVVRSGILSRTIPTALAGRELTINQDLKAIVASARIEPRFLAHFFRVSEAYLLGKVTRGATVHKLDTHVIKSLPIPLPPLEEQRRIVAILDEAFEGLDRARANAETNLQSARELFESFLGAVFSDRSASWIAAPLAELVAKDCSLSYGIVQPGDEISGGLPIVRPTDLGRRVITLDGLKLIDPKRAAGYSRTKLNGTEILLCVRGSTGVVALAAEELAGANVTRGIVPVRFDPKRLDQKLGYYQFLSKPVQDQIRAGTYGAALMQINIGDLRKLTFTVPPVREQGALLERLESVADDFDRLTEDYARKFQDVADLRQSLLQKAFAGELTSRKPHNVRLPGNDNMPLSAQILALGYSRHQSALRERTCGHVKAQKLLHLAEAVCGYDLCRVPIKDAAGPNDMAHMRGVEDWAKANRVFEFQRRPSGGYTFVPLEAFSQSIRNLQAVPESRLDRLIKIVDLIVPMDSEDAEVLATVHAAWSNLIQDGAMITDELIVTAAREEWHPDKMKIARFKFFNAIRSIKAASIEPDGTAQYVGTKQGKLL